MKARELDNYTGELSLILRPGTAWLLYTDDGPSGPCGQSMRVTCPHAALHVFTDEAAMYSYQRNKQIGRNKKAKIWSGVVGQYTTPGVFTIVTHDEQEAQNHGD